MHDMIFNVWYKFTNGDPTVIHTKFNITWEEFKDLDSLNCIKITHFISRKKGN